MSDGSPAWVNEALGWRLILDDGAHRAELVLARDPGTRQRVLRVEGAAGVGLIAFPWDNDFHNVYEIGRLASGDFVVTAINKDPVATTQLPPKQIPAGSLPGTQGAILAWGTGLAGGGASFWQSAHAEVLSAALPFASFRARADIYLGPRPGDDRFDVEALFTLGAGSDGINPLTEDVTLMLGPGEWTIPAGSFRRQRGGWFSFRGFVGTTGLGVAITPLGGGRFGFAALGAGAELSGVANPVAVGLTIGDDAGETDVLAYILA